MRSLRVNTARVTLLLLLVLAPGSIGAQPAPAEYTTPGGIRFHHLALPADTHHALALGWHDAADHAEPGKERLPQVSARLIMEGTQALNESARVERLKDLQATLGLSATRDLARALIAAPPAHLGEVAGMLGDMLSAPALPESKLVLARRNAQLAWPSARESAETLAGQAFLRLVLGEGPVLKSVLGDPAAEAGIGAADVAAWRGAVLGRQPAAIVSAGPMPPDAVAREIDRLFAALPPPTARGGTRPQLRGPGKFVVIERPTVQTAIVAGGPTGWIADGNAVLGGIAVRVLGGGFASRLTKAVREGLGATYGIRASLQQIHAEAFVLNIASQVDSAKGLPALHAIRAEYARLHSGGVTMDEVEPIKTRLVTDMREQYRRSSGAAQSLRDVLLAGLPADYAATYPARTHAVTADAVNAGIRERMPLPPLTIVVVTPSAAGLDADCVISAPEEIGKCE